MLIGDNSPLRRLPQLLDRRQALYIDGIRIAIEAADISYARLIETLTILSDVEEQGGSNPLAAYPYITSAIIDAWAVIDALNRISWLVRRMPGVKQKAPGLQIFVRSLNKVETLRHTIQHLHERIDELVAAGVPAWGRLVWIVVDVSTAILRTCSLVPGTTLSASHPLQNPVGRKLHPPIDRVTLQSGGDEMDLSDAMRTLRRFVSAMEAELESQFKDLPHHGSDVVVVVVLAPVKLEGGSGD